MSDLREAEVQTESAERALARKRGYVDFNSFLVGVWTLTGGGYFWPAWVLACWGAGMLIGLWDYWRGPVTDADVEAEVRRMRH